MLQIYGRSEDQCLILIKDVKTRWNSTYLMISRYSPVYFHIFQ